MSSDHEESTGVDPADGDYLGPMDDPWPEEDEEGSSHGLEPLADDYQPIGEVFSPPPEPGVVVVPIRPLPHGSNAALVAAVATRPEEFLSHWEAIARNAAAELPGEDLHLNPGAALEAFDRRIAGIWKRGGPKLRYNLERAVTGCERRMDTARATLAEARRHNPQPRRSVGPAIDFTGASA
jgi:hypothetical protein